MLERQRPRPVAPRRASCRDVPGSRVAAAGSGWGGAGAAPEADRCRALPRGHTRLGHAVTGTRGCECAMRARRGRCACPRVPLPSRRSSSRQSGKRTTRTRQLGVARRGKIRGGGQGVAAPAGLGSPHGAPESERGGRRAGCAAAATSRRLQAPPAGRLGSSPFLSTHCSIPHALQGSQTGLQQPRGPQSKQVPESVRGDYAPCAAARNLEEGWVWGARCSGSLELAGSSEALELLGASRSLEAPLLGSVLG